MEFLWSHRIPLKMAYHHSSSIVTLTKVNVLFDIPQGLYEEYTHMYRHGKEIDQGITYFIVQINQDLSVC